MEENQYRSGNTMGARIDVALVGQALRSACLQRRPPLGLILHSDRGSQYVSQAYRTLAKSWGLTMSMSRRAKA